MINSVPKNETVDLLVGFPEEAIQSAQHAYEMRKGDVYALNTLIESCVFAGQFQKAKQWLAQWEELQPDTPHRHSKIVTNINSILEQAKVSDETTGKVIQIAFSVLRNHGIHIGHNIAYSNATREDDETQWVTRTIIIDQPDIEAIELNIELAEKLAEQEELGKQLKGKFIVRYISAG
jgi:hypothetical protein